MAENIALSIKPEMEKDSVLNEIERYMASVGLRYCEKNGDKPWGAYYVIDPEQTPDFIKLYYPDYPLDQIQQFGNALAGKLLIPAPMARLSWQTHERRAELWRCIFGPVAYVTSPTEVESKAQLLQPGDTVQMDAKAYHRLQGHENWGVVAEIWQHTDPSNPSDEDDIFRAQDDYGR
jgi:mannose-6-phosphate isomerase